MSRRQGRRNALLETDLDRHLQVADGEPDSCTPDQRHEGNRTSPQDEGPAEDLAAKAAFGGVDQETRAIQNFK